MKRLTIVLLTLFSLFIFAQGAFCLTGNISGFAGFRALEDNEWEPVDVQLQLGAVSDITPDNWPVSIAVDLLFSAAGEEDEYVGGSLADITGAVLELDVGVRKIFDTGSAFSPYVGGGVAFASASYKVDYVFGPTDDDDDSGIGVWVGGGFYLPFTSHFHMGFDIRFSAVEVTLFNEDVNAGGLQMGVLAGYHF